MAVKLSRRSLATYFVDGLLADDAAVVDQLAAYIVQSRRVRELDLLIRDIETLLTERGVVVSTVASARELSDQSVERITAFLSEAYNGARVSLRHVVEPELLGGVRVTTPDAELDSTLKRRITQLNTLKV